MKFLLERTDIIQFIYSLIGTPLGYILYFIYRFICSNVGIAIMIFTLIVKLAMLPLSIKQQKASAKTSVFQPKVMEIQQKYKNNTQKQQEELMKLQQMGYKPMSGCGTMLLSFLILFGVIDVVYKPLTHIVHMSNESITEISEESYNVEAASFFAQAFEQDIFSLDEAGAERVNKIRNDAQLIVDYYNEHCLKEGASPYDVSDFAKPTVESASVIRLTFKHAIAETYKADTSDKKKQKSLVDTDLYALTDAEKAELDVIVDEAEREKYRAGHSFSQPTVDMLNNCNIHYGNYVCSSDSSTFAVSGTMQRELYVLERFGSEVGVDKNKCSDAYTLRPEVKEELTELYDNLNFIGIPLGQVPKDNMGFPMILIPIVSFLMSMLQTFISQRLMTQSNPEAATARGMGPMKVMLFIMPLMSLWIAFTVPAGAGFYWTVSYLYGIIQTVVLNKVYNPAKLRAQAEEELKALTKKQNKKKAVDVDAVVVADDGTKETISQKELYRRKLAAARKADAEKYGEEDPETAAKLAAARKADAEKYGEEYHEDGDN